MDIIIQSLYKSSKVGLNREEMLRNKLYHGKIVGIRKSRSRNNKLGMENDENSKTLIIVTNSKINKKLLVGKNVEIRIIRGR